MKALIVYDSVYGNTEKIARSIGDAIGGDVKVHRTSEVCPSDLESIDLLVVGSPTYAGRTTPAMQDFLKHTVTGSSLKDVSVAAFDTRLTANWVKIFGFASEKIANSLKANGGTPVLSPQGFYV